ncbi:hypothetical protein QWA68_014956 [Fusarium oxysporum]|uniref:Beta-xylosidase C-terminal Concanavalin A-like domain-containing protein n=1 Tax=Fusarium oxysporum TaxID=5507 RepID=A0A8H5A523_FUSOX|nr:hypothetical protein FOXYS1_10384 [Fusarium oxysporum]KAK2686775.1 hypothetical protein QWA68_014956 [Fusarium oxysporum]
MAASNPVIPGFAPDPSVTLIGDTFFLVNSSFHLFPGLPIYASRDLQTWTHIGNAINRTSQLSLSGSTVLVHGLDDPKADKTVAAGGLYAPTIRHQNGRIYIVCTNVEHFKTGKTDGAWGIKFHNFIISTDDIWACDWSNPVYFDFYGIDPDLFFDDNGRVYVSGSSWNSNPSTINCFEIDLVTGEKLTPERTIWDGFSKIIPEGPHIYKRGEWYYLLDAEGGTHEGHRLAMARSRDIFGPYEQCPHNPILRPQSQDDKPYVCWAGHGDLIQDPKGAWWLLCLAARLDKQGRCGLGRESFLTSVAWPSDGSWPEIAQPITLSLPDNLLTTEPLPQKTDPRNELLWIRNIDLTAFEVSKDAQDLQLRASADDLTDSRSQPVSFVGKRQRKLQGTISVGLSLSQSIGGSRMKAGLAYYKDEHRFARVYFNFSTMSVWTDVRNSGRRPNIQRNKEIVKLDKHQIERAENIAFRIQFTETALEMQYSLCLTDGPYNDGWVDAGSADVLDLTDRDFTGPCFGVFATTKSTVEGYGNEVVPALEDGSCKAILQKFIME